MAGSLAPRAGRDRSSLPRSGRDFRDLHLEPQTAGDLFGRPVGALEGAAVNDLNPAGRKPRGELLSLFKAALGQPRRPTDDRVTEQTENAYQQYLGSKTSEAS